MRPRPSRLAPYVLLSSLSLASTARMARAEEPLSAPTVTNDGPSDSDEEARRQIDRTTLYGDDARIPRPMTAVVTSSFSYTSIGGDPTQVSSPYPKAGPGCYNAAGSPQGCYAPLANNTATPGGQLILTGEIGLLPRLSLLGNIAVGTGTPGGGPSSNVGGALAVRADLLPESWTETHLVVSGGYIREAWNPPVYNGDRSPAVWLPGTQGGVNAAYAQVAVSRDIGRLRLGGMLHLQHTFADGRDPLDVMVDVTATYNLVGDVRIGGEYVGQDVEEVASSTAEGGTRHFLGPIASLQLWKRRITLVGGPFIGLSALSPDFVGRVAASAAF